MEHNPEHNPEHSPEHNGTLRRRLGLVAAGLAFAVPVVGLATYGVAGATGAQDDPPEEQAQEEEVVDDCGEDPTDEDIAASNEEEDALAAFLDERGIPYTREEEDGIRWVFWDENDQAANDAVDEFFAERYPLTPEDVAAANEEEDALAAFLDERGVRYTRDASADGVSYVVWDENDEAASAAVEEYYAEHFPTPPEQLAALQAQEDELAAFLDQRGIAYTREADAEGVQWVVWEDTDDAANAAVEEFYESQGPASCVGMVELEAEALDAG